MNTDPLGQICRTGETFEVSFERHYRQPPERVWAALTTPKRIEAWFAAARVDLRLGGRYELCFDGESWEGGEIIELEPPRRLAWRWPHMEHPNSVVRWELEPDAGGCRLRLTQTDLLRGHLREVAPGWHVMLENLPFAADGLIHPWTLEREEALAPLYAPLIPL